MKTTNENENEISIRTVGARANALFRVSILAPELRKTPNLAGAFTLAEAEEKLREQYVSVRSRYVLLSGPGVLRLRKVGFARVLLELLEKPAPQPGPGCFYGLTGPIAAAGELPDSGGHMRPAFSVAGRAAKWSTRQKNGFAVPPAIGERVRITFNGFGAGVVVSYAIEAGWLGVAVKCDQRPAWHVEQNGSLHPYPIVFGAELERADTAPTTPDTGAAVAAMTGDDRRRAKEPGPAPFLGEYGAPAQQPINETI